MKCVSDKNYKKKKKNSGPTHFNKLLMNNYISGRHTKSMTLNLL
jgi:hypothetical protein